VTLIQRELFESSLQSASSVLELLGYATPDANRIVQLFKTHNLELLEQMHPHYKDRAKVISTVKQGRAQLAEQMAKEREMAGKSAL
jgi:glutathione-regulated potassium-efflux system ancillary protein KefC